MNIQEKIDNIFLLKSIGEKAAAILLSYPIDDIKKGFIKDDSKYGCSYIKEHATQDEKVIFELDEYCDTMSRTLRELDKIIMIFSEIRERDEALIANVTNKDLLGFNYEFFLIKLTSISDVMAIIIAILLDIKYDPNYISIDKIVGKFKNEPATLEVSRSCNLYSAFLKPYIKKRNEIAHRGNLDSADMKLLKQEPNKRVKEYLDLAKKKGIIVDELDSKILKSMANGLDETIKYITQIFDSLNDNINGKYSKTTSLESIYKIIRIS